MIRNFLHSLVLILLFSNPSFSQRYLVKYGVNDCINCSSQLTEIQKILDTAQVTFIFPEKFMPDSSLVKERFGLDIFNYKMAFSDELFEKYVKGGESYFIIDSDTAVLLAKVKEVNIPELKQIIDGMQQKSESVCLQRQNSDDQFTLFENDLIISSNSALCRYTLHDAAHKSVTEFMADSLWTEAAYHTFYEGKDDEEALSFMKALLRANPSKRPTIEKATISGNHLYFLLSVPFVKSKDTATRNVVLGTKRFIREYDTRKQAFGRCLFIDESSVSPYGINTSSAFFRKDNSFIFCVTAGDSIRENDDVLASCADSGGAHLKMSLLPFSAPHSYPSYGLTSGFMHLKCYHNLLSFSLSDKVYDLKSGKEYTIPFPEGTFANLEGMVARAMNDFMEGKALENNFFWIYDIRDEGYQYRILYQMPDGVFAELKVDRASGEASHKALSIDVHTVKTIKYNDRCPDCVSLFKKEDTCFRFMKISEL